MLLRVSSGLASRLAAAVPRHGAGRIGLYQGGVAFSTCPPLRKQQMPSRPQPPPMTEIDESYLKGSGPGGQKINKTNSAVQLIHKPTGIVVKCQATRSREQNRKIAREILAAKVDVLVNGSESRTAIVSEVKKKRSDSAAKKSRRKYRKLEEAAEQGAAKADVADIAPVTENQQTNT
ncbi:peptide chain release factor-like protein [Podospora appendiculata]|uniref:Peptide chain release factor-like protein n=1 Tax=Podospora appendiculata TaxID=314037 RepID=A0AAE0X6D2_9PEZI|nr:peptide chain release factor-like protein [Podospora appendiculata]